MTETATPLPANADATAAPSPSPGANAWAAGGDEVARLKADPEFIAALTSHGHPLNAEAQRRWQAAHGIGATDAAQSTPSSRLADGPPAEASAYEIPAPPLGVPQMPDDDAREWRATALAAGLSNEDFAWFSSAAYGAAKSGAPDADTGRADLVARHGEERARELVVKGRQFIAALPAAQRETVSSWLDDSGLGNSPLVIERLALLADRKARR